MSDWLDTETKANLAGVPPEKLAPPDLSSFALVLLTKPPDEARLCVGLARTQCFDPDRLPSILAGELPQVLACGLTHEAALLGQFELACCDAIAVFLRDEVVADDDRGYLAQLYADLLASDEFRLTKIAIRTLPNDSRGQRFLDQFVGAGVEWLQAGGWSLRFPVTHKKARFMCHWGSKIGADVSVEK